EDGVGIAAANGKKIEGEADLGLVSNKFEEMWERLSKKLGEVKSAIAHTRYPTEGEVTAANAQPFIGDTQHGRIAYGHNGELTNFGPLRREFEKSGITFTKSSDSEMFLPAFARANGSTLEEKLATAASQLKGAFSIVGITESTLFAIRDQYGIKPLSIARLNGGYIITSETCAFLDIEGAQWVSDVKPGHIMTISQEGIQEKMFAQESRWHPCIFELVYFARPDSHIAGRNVHLVRRELGKQLWKEAPIEADIVVAVEDSGRSAAEGFSEASGIPQQRGYVRNHYVTRTFTRPTDILRERGVNLKLSPIKEVVDGKRIVVVDDSIVRGKTAESRVRLLKQAGAKEVYLYIASPKLIGDCYYGIDFHRADMRAIKMPDDREFMGKIGVERLVHLSLEGMFKAIERVPLDPRGKLNYEHKDFCTGCMTLHYPVPKEE
ncbi:MAG: amidophosphoribosyltransferase, partial [Nanoarchaeota archaeon]